MKIANSKFRGTGVAIVTPFRKSGVVDFDAFERVMNHIIDGDVSMSSYLELPGNHRPYQNMKKKPLSSLRLKRIQEESRLSSG